MAWEIPSGNFSVEPLIKPGFQPWPKQEPIPEVELAEFAWKNDNELKKLFGVALAKFPKNAFEAALEVFPDTNQAVWASHNWAKDPLVLGSRDIYLDSVTISNNLLSKEQLAAKLLAFADEKDASGRFYICEAKDRLSALKLYAEVSGYVGKIAIDASTNNFTNNELKVTLVKAVQAEQQKAVTVIEPETEIVALPLNLKLVNSR